MRASLLAATAITALVIPGMVSAQAAETSLPTASAAPAASTGAGIQDIVVTAQRRSENLQHAALAVSAVSGDALMAAGISKPTQLTSVVPALQVVPSAGPYSLFYLRGVGNFSGNALADSAVAFNFDGVYVGRPSSTTGFFYDLDRVEVLKGPQGTLYGRNATGGAINVITHKPDLGVTSISGSAEYGNYNAVRADGAVNLPLGQDVALRVAGIYVRHDGYMKDGTDDQNDLGGRISLRADPASNLKIVVTADYFRQRGDGVGAVSNTQDADDRQGLKSANGAAALAVQPNFGLGRTFAPLDFASFMRNRYWGVSSTIEWKVPIGTITIIPAHREGSLNFQTDAAGFLIHQIEKDKQNSVEFRLASDEKNPFRYLFGAFYYDESNNIPFYNLNQQNLINQQFYHPTTKSMAVFGRLTYAITPAIRLSAGGRYTTEDKKFNGQLAYSIRQCVIPSTYFPTYVPGCPTAQPFPYGAQGAIPNFIPGPDGTITIPGLIDETGSNARHASFDKFTYRFGADWDITSHNLLYASYETGFKSGGFFFSADNGTFKPEEIRAWTVGSKNRFFNNKLQLNLEGFYWKYKNQQISHLSLDSTGDVIFATENVGKATFKGVEAEAQYLLTRNTLLSADLQYLDAKYNSFVYTTPNLNGGVGNGTGCPNVGTPGVVYTVNCSGNRPPNAPKWTLNLGAQQTIPVGDGKIVLDARGHYQTRTLTGLEFTGPEYQTSYWTVDAQVSYTAPKSRFTIGAFINNLTNKTIVSSIFPVPSSLFYAETLRPPRTYGIRGGFKF